MGRPRNGYAETPKNRNQESGGENMLAVWTVEWALLRQPEQPASLCFVGFLFSDPPLKLVLND